MLLNNDAMSKDDMELEYLLTIIKARHILRKIKKIIK